MVDKTFFDNFGPFSLNEIAKISEAEIYVAGNANNMLGESFLIKDVHTLDQSGPTDLSFFLNTKYLEQFKQSKAGVCIVSAKYVDDAPEGMILLISNNVYRSYAMVAQAFYPMENLTGSIASSAVIDGTARIGKDTTISHGVIISANASIANNCIIGSNSVIGKSVVIGKNSVIGAGVHISNAIIGNNVLIHPGAAIGQDGFGIATGSDGVHIKVPQLGRVVIGNDVEIGANTCIDRGTIQDTVIGNNCKIDNLVQIGHNVELGTGCIVVAQVGISGSTKLGSYVVVGGQVGIAGHLNIGDAAQIAAQSGVISDIKTKEIMGGYPAVPVRQWHKQSVLLKKLTLTKQKKDD